MNPVSTQDFLETTYRTDLDLLVGRWMRQITLDELQQGYLVLLDRAAEYKCRFWLIDVRRRVDTDSSAGTWMLDAFAPQLPQRLGGTAYLAYLLAPAHLRHEQVQNTFPPPGYFKNKPYKADRFTDERQAVEWLQLHHEQEAAV